MMTNHRLISALAMAALTSAAAAQQPAAIDWHAIESTLGRAGLPQPAGVMRFNFPRSDLDVHIGDVKIVPALALGGWVAFMPAGTNVIAMGDLVLTIPEVAAVSKALQQGGVEITAEHNHLIGEDPRIMYLHIMATGSAASIATAIHDALAMSGTPMTMATAAPVPLKFSLDTAALAKAFGVAGKVNGGVYQSSIPRKTPVMIGAMTIPPSMGLATVINVQPIDSTMAVATGDFVLTMDQVTPVVRALTSHGVTVTAVHSHLMGSQPELRFVHFWAKDTSTHVIEALAAAVAAE
jgi:hypothetical protein